MNSFTNAILTLMLGWLRTLLNVARDFISSDSSTIFFDFFRNNWKILFVILCLGGFAMDKIVYLIRWRPSPIWIRLRKRRKKKHPQPQPAYIEPEYPLDSEVAFNEDTAVVETRLYQPAMNAPAADAAPTMQYQIQPRFNEPLYDAPGYTAPYIPPEPNPADAPVYQEEPALPYEPVSDQQRFAFGMAPSFGSAQSEPTYNYYRNATPSFAPPQYTQQSAEPTFAPQNASAPPPAYFDPASYEAELYDPAPSEAEPYEPEPHMQPEDQEPRPYFRPFSDRREETFAPPRNRRFGNVARKARTLLNADDEQALSYQDLQSTVDVSKAFHSPVYPQKNPEGE